MIDLLNSFFSETPWVNDNTRCNQSYMYSHVHLQNE